MSGSLILSTKAFGQNRAQMIYLLWILHIILSSSKTNHYYQKIDAATLLALEYYDLIHKKPTLFILKSGLRDQSYCRHNEFKTMLYNITMRRFRFTIRLSYSSSKFQIPTTKSRFFRDKYLLYLFSIMYNQFNCMQYFVQLKRRTHHI